MKKFLLSDLFISVLTAIFVVFITQPQFFQVSLLKGLELKTIDARFKARGSIQIDSPKVIIVQISDESFEQILPPDNKWPWPRNLFSKLVDNLTAAGAKAIGIDVIMSSGDRISAFNDSLLMCSIRKSGKVVVAGKINVEDESLKLASLKNQMKNRTAKQRSLNLQMTQDFSNVKFNFHNIFFDADKFVGLVQIPSDDDAIKRRYTPFINFGLNDSLSQKIPSFSFALLNKYFGKNSSYTAKDSGDYFVYLGRKIPKYDSESFLINYYGGAQSFQYYNFFEVIDDSTIKVKDEVDYNTELNQWDTYLQEGIFKNKIVLVGSTMPEDKDIFPTSLSINDKEGSNLLWGVAIHATVIENILNNNFLYKQSQTSEVAAAVLLTLLVFCFSSLTKKLKIKLGMLLELVSIIFIILIIYSIYLLSVYFFVNKNYVINVVTPTVAVLLGYFTSTVNNFIKERQKNMLIKNMFSQYVNKSVVNELIAHPERLKLGGERKTLTILFCDMVGFTTISEKKEPEELVALMNVFLNEMSEIIISNDGTVDKFLGDAIMAFWGAPVQVNDHAYKACKTALLMQQKLDGFKLLKSSIPEIQIRIGINTGEVIIGNIGGAKRFDYTVMGDNVNLASRLESANKEYGTSIMISENTYELVKDKIAVRELDLVKVKGRKSPTKIYEIIGELDNPLSDEKLKKLECYFEGMKYYRSHNFSEAVNYFEKCVSQTNDPPSKVYIERCKLFLSNPPDSNWDGVFVLQNK
ncbi:CHASE2 domain-containing protein [Melioribacteraceae bacterium 4301-Me]|uniref:CHASE2 domain-containing protein n=1 Tax=Pyranulibacter aquaticus TaxID=3163344 RepID=UPI00359A1C09